MQFDAPADVEGVATDTVEVWTKGTESLSAEHVVFDQEGRRLVVRLDDSDLVSLIDNTENGQTTPFDCYIGYTSSEYERIYFEFSKLNADIEAKVKHDAHGQERREKKRSVTR